MVEREANHEDDKIRARTFRDKGRKVDELEGNPTALCLDTEKEEIFESRTYRFRSGPQSLMVVIGLVTQRQLESGMHPSSEGVMRIAVDLMADTAFKFLAKRRVEDGLITFVLVFATPDSRCLLSRQEWVNEAEYRLAVREFEQGFLAKCVLGPSVVIDLEQWRRSAQERQLSGSGGKDPAVSPHHSG